jgi:hypothetical protein
LKQAACRVVVVAAAAAAVVAASLLIKGNQMGEVSNLGWLIGLVKHGICVSSFCFFYLLLFSVSKILT